MRHGERPRSARARRSPGGFLIVYVFLLAIVIGALVFAYHQSFRHRNVQVRLNTDRSVARFLARAGIDILKFSFREAALSPPSVNADLNGGLLSEFFLNAPDGLKAKIEQKVRGASDHRSLLNQLLGSEALKPLDALAARYPGAGVQLFLVVDPAPLFPESPIKDKILKTVGLTYRSLATVRKAQEVMEHRETATVMSLFPPIASKFTLATLGSEFNLHKVTTQGGDAGGPAPVVTFHDPADCDPIVTNPLKVENATEKALVSQPISPKELVSAFEKKGMLYLSGAGADKIAVLDLASGGTPFGEHHTVYQPKSGKSYRPQAVKLPGQPRLMESFRPRDPLDPLVRQGAFTQGAVFGLFEGIDEQDVLGPPIGGGQPSAVSQLKPYGTGSFPSPTVVVGGVYRMMAGISDIASDRDCTGKDESAQTAATGRPLPQREGVDPFLRNCDEATYKADVALERAGNDPAYARLLPFGTNGLVMNQNVLADLDGDGVRETPVPSEIAHNPLQLDLAEWKYSRLFKDHDEYAQHMSKYVQFPANLSLSLGGESADRSAERLGELAFGKPMSGLYDDYIVRELKLEHRDGVHKNLGGDDESTRYVDSRGMGQSSLEQWLLGCAHNRSPAETTYLVVGQAKFEQWFMPGGVLDLQGKKVRVFQDLKPGSPMPLQFDRVVQVKPGSGGVLETPLFKARGLVNPGTDRSFAPLIVKTGQLLLTDKGPFEAYFVPGTVTQQGAQEYTVLKGGMMSSLSAFSNLTNPLLLCYDTRYDPTSEVAPTFYRVALPVFSEKTYDYPERP